MSHGSTVELASYADRFAAEAVRTRLAAAGIKAEVFGTDAATAFSMGGAPQKRLVRIEVARDQVEQAKALLEKDREAALQRGPWKCDACGENNEATFDMCWKCGSTPEPNLT